MKKIILLLFLTGCAKVDIKPYEAVTTILQPPPYTYELIIVAGQSNAGQIPFGMELANTNTWNVNTFKMSTRFGKSETFGGNIGFLYFLSSRLKLQYPDRKFIFMQYNLRSTSLISTSKTAWNPKTSYNLFYNLANHTRDCIIKNGKPNSIHFFWVHGEEDNGALASDYLKAETNLYDSLPSYTQIGYVKWHYYTYIPKSVTDPAFCSTVIDAKKQHAKQNTRIKLFEVDIKNYTGIHMITTSGLIVCTDTLMKKIKF